MHQGIAVTKVMRQSYMNDGDVCLRRMHYGMTQPRHGGEARAVGTAYHAALETLYARGTLDVTELTQVAFDAWEIEVKSASEFHWDSTDDEARARIATMVEAYVDGEHYWKPDRWRVLATELRFDFPFADPLWRAQGTVDLVLQDNTNGWVVLVDHKTATRKWRQHRESTRNQNQTLWYVAWVRKWFESENQTPPPMRFFFDVMPYDKRFERKEVTFTDTEVDRILMKAKMYQELVDKDGPFLPNTQHYLCSKKWCDWWTICPFGETFHYE